MLHYKPRLRNGTSVSNWIASSDSKNRGFINKRFINRIIEITDYVKRGTDDNYPKETNTDQGILLVPNFGPSRGAIIWWLQKFTYPVDIITELKINGAADGICILIVRSDSPELVGGTGGGGGNAVPNLTQTNGAPCSWISLDQWSNGGQPTPYYGFADIRRGNNNQQPAHYVNTPVNDNIWHTVRVLWQGDNTVTVWKDGAQILTGNWFNKTGYNLPENEVRIGYCSATGLAYNDAYIRKVTVNGNILYKATGL